MSLNAQAVVPTPSSQASKANSILCLACLGSEKFLKFLLALKDVSQLSVDDLLGDLSPTSSKAATCQLVYGRTGSQANLHEPQYPLCAKSSGKKASKKRAAEEAWNVHCPGFMHVQVSC